MKQKSTEQFIIDAYCKHGDKYNYKLVDYITNKTKVKIICPVHGVFEQVPGNHKRGQGCKKCASFKHSCYMSKSTEQFIIDAYCKHGDKYNYKLVDYKCDSVKVKIICPVHGVFEQSKYSHIQGYGCKKCSLSCITKDNIYFAIRASSIHNNKYDYSLVDYKKSKTKVKIICPVHGVFEQRPDNHYHGQGCPNCISVNYTSEPERELADWLQKYIDIECSDRSLINPLELDIVIPSKKIAIEYNGLYWHSEQQGKNRSYHLNKYNLCKDKGYRLIQIWENEWLLKKDIVKSIILNVIGKHTNKIHGRKCIINTVQPKEARLFYNNNHIQGFKGGEHHGLYHKGELVSLLTIDKRNELQRFVNRRNTIVHGSFSKLLKSFNHNDIYTFADLRYFTGDVYRNNGFKEVYLTTPNYYYFKKLSIYHRRGFQKSLLENKLDNYNPSLTEYQNMVLNGYDRIWDCGNLKFVFRKIQESL